MTSATTDHGCQPRDQNRLPIMVPGLANVIVGPGGVPGQGPSVGGLSTSEMAYSFQPASVRVNA